MGIVHVEARLRRGGGPMTQAVAETVKRREMLASNARWIFVWGCAGGTLTISVREGGVALDIVARWAFACISAWRKKRV